MNTEQEKPVSLELAKLRTLHNKFILNDGHIYVVYITKKILTKEQVIKSPNFLERTLFDAKPVTRLVEEEGIKEIWLTDLSEDRARKIQKVFSPNRFANVVFKKTTLQDVTAADVKNKLNEFFWLKYDFSRIYTLVNKETFLKVKNI